MISMIDWNTFWWVSDASVGAFISIHSSILGSSLNIRRFSLSVFFELLDSSSFFCYSVRFSMTNRAGSTSPNGYIIACNEERYGNSSMKIFKQSGMYWKKIRVMLIKSVYMKSWCRASTREKLCSVGWVQIYFQVASQRQRSCSNLINHRSDQRTVANVKRRIH